MYEKNDILDLETKVLAIFMHYSYIQISFNDYCKNEVIDKLDISKKINDTKLTIYTLRSLLFKLTPIKYSLPVDYNEIARGLYYLGSLSRKKHHHHNKMIWDDTTNIVERGGFSTVFGHLISRLRRLEKKIDAISLEFINLSQINVGTLNDYLLNLNTQLQDFISYTQATKIMLNYIDNQQLFAKASCNKDFVIPKKGRPKLRIVRALNIVKSN
mgnify:CR=1 FL=1